MKNYYRVILGKKNIYASDCYRDGYIGCHFEIEENLTGKLPDNWKEFNKAFIPKWLAINPKSSKISAGLACGALWTITKGIRKGDIILSPDGSGSYYIGEVAEDYSYAPNTNLPHRRKVRWSPTKLDKESMSDPLKNSLGSINTVAKISKHFKEIEVLISGPTAPILSVNDETIDDPSTFALEKHLEDFLVLNWSQTELGKKYEIFSENGELVGQQYPTDTGNIDILAISKDKKELLVLELKKGRASDSVVGQIQRYMGFVVEELAEEGQEVKGVIIALEDDLRIKRALSVAKNIEFYRYQISFKLFKNS